jgi:hypothetical protein
MFDPQRPHTAPKLRFSGRPYCSVQRIIVAEAEARRYRAILLRLAGYAPREIARRLGVSAGTVGKYLRAGGIHEEVEPGVWRYRVTVDHIRKLGIKQRDLSWYGIPVGGEWWREMVDYVSREGE